MDPLQKHVEEVVAPVWNYAGRCHSIEDEIQNATLGLVGESGEVADIVKKMFYHAPKDYRDKLRHEMGDVAFYFGQLLKLFDFTLEEVLEANKEKLESRHPELGKVDERFGEGYIRG